MFKSTNRSRWVWLIGLLAVAVVAAGAAMGLGVLDRLGASGGNSGSDSSDPGESAPPATGQTTTGQTATGPAADDPVLDAALSNPTRDSVYPNVGQPEVDALHYLLKLRWDPERKRLDGTERLVFRATTTQDLFRLDLSSALEVTSVTVDDAATSFRRGGHKLVIEHPISADQRYVVEIDYTGSPRPVQAPSDRGDVDTIGWHTTAVGDTWTMQEPYGAFTWYAVNDHPSDKALYDFVLDVPGPRVGVANGILRSSIVTEDDRSIQSWHLADPAASYLVTAAFGEYHRTDDTTDSGVPITYWIPNDDQDSIEQLRKIVPAAAWAEKRLGPYPWPSLGMVLVDSDSAMETQSMLTLGDTERIKSESVLFHELIHQWYGDLVSPADWRDVWLNEGMTMYLQGVYDSELEDRPVDETMAEWAKFDPLLRDEAGPPGDYDPQRFASGNVYYCPALMWHEIRRHFGEKRFWAMVREWPESRARGNATREDLFAFVTERGEAPEGTTWPQFFDAWLLGDTTPPRR